VSKISPSDLQGFIAELWSRSKSCQMILHVFGP